MGYLGLPEKMNLTEEHLRYRSGTCLEMGVCLICSKKDTHTQKKRRTQNSVCLEQSEPSVLLQERRNRKVIGGQVVYGFVEHQAW